MIGVLGRAFDNLFGRGEAAVTVPPLDGALQPNRRLDEAEARADLDDVDCLAVRGGVLFASAGANLFTTGADGQWKVLRSYEARVTALAPAGDDALAVGLANGDVVIDGGRYHGRTYRVGGGFACITSLTATGSSLLVAIGSAANAAEDWQRDLLQRNASGSVWRIDLENGATTRIAEGLAWPAGIVADGDDVVVSEAWNHRLVRIGSAGRLEVLHADLPGYPGRLSRATDGYWLSMFAPRSQIIEFVLREPAYRERMMAEVPQSYWVAPRLRSGRSFYETLQGGAVKHLGMLKPWAPTMSAGLCVRLDAGFQPRSSLQSRADGRTHGVTSAVEHGGNLHVAARGDGVVVSIPLVDLGGRA